MDDSNAFDSALERMIPAGWILHFAGYTRGEIAKVIFAREDGHGHPLIVTGRGYTFGRAMAAALSRLKNEGADDER